MLRLPPRFAFNGLSLLSLLVFIALAVLLVRSYAVCDAVDWGTSAGRAGLASFRGRVSVGAVRVAPAGMAGVPRGLSWRAEPAATQTSGALNPNWSFAGLQAARIKPAPGALIWDVRVPHGYLMIVAAVAPGVWVLRRLRRPGPGMCPLCGYDLRASPDQCPECGTTSMTDRMPAPSG